MRPPARNNFERLAIVATQVVTCGEIVAPHLLGAVGVIEDGQPAVGQFRSEGHVLGPEAGDVDGDVLAHGMVDELEGLAQTGSLVSRQWQRIHRAVGDDLFATPNLAADVDGLAGCLQRLLVRHAVPAFDHLRAGRTNTERESAAGYSVESGRGHGQQRWRAAVKRKDSRGEFDRFGLGCEEAQDRHGVEAVQLGDPQHVDSGALQVGGLIGCRHRIAAVTD